MGWWMGQLIITLTGYKKLSGLDIRILNPLLVNSWYALGSFVNTDKNLISTLLAGKE